MVVDRTAEARSGFERWDADIMESVYSTLFLDVLKLRNFQGIVRNAANSRCLVDMYIPPTASARALALAHLHIFCVRLLQVLLVLLYRACEGLRTWNGQTVRLSRFFFETISNSQGEPGGKIPVMKNVFFKPWVGKDYESGGIFGRRILVLGEAHICGGCADCGRVADGNECADFTSTNCMELLLEGHTDTWTATFRKFERSLAGHDTTPDESREIWNSVAFYNYVQKSMDESRKSPEWVDFRDSEDAFFEVIDCLRPDLIIVWGVTRMYDCMPGGERWRPGNELVIDNYAVKNGYYRLADDKDARVLWVYHPSAGYSWDWWNKVISTEL